jgi:putative Holliday junction resolvase
MRYLAVDPGEKRIGLALSDLTGMLARPLSIIRHTTRDGDVQAIVRAAQEQQAEKIIIGQALGGDGELTLSAKRAINLAEAVRGLTSLPVELWDESFSTQTARSLRLEMGARKSRRGGHQDDLAAAVILQNYLDQTYQPEYPPTQVDDNANPTSDEG